MRYQKPNDLLIHGQVVDKAQLKSQLYLDQIDLWTEKQEMLISEKKTKVMLVNFTENYQFHTRLQLKNRNIQVVDSIKILGTTFNNKITWDENCTIIIKKVNARMQLLRKVWSFGSSVQEMVHLWQIYCLSILEQSCVVWGN